MDIKRKTGRRDRDAGRSVNGRAGIGRVAGGLSALLLFFAIILTSGPASAVIVDRIVAVVNDSIITMSELNAAKALAKDSLGSASDTDDVKLESTVLDGLIEQKLVKQASDRAGIEVTEIEIDKAIEDVKKNNRLTQDKLLLALASSGLTYKEYRHQIMEQLRQLKFVNQRFRSNILIKDEDLEEYYLQNIEKFHGPPSIRIRLLFFSNEDEQLRDKRLKSVLASIKNGEEFAGLAKELSQGPAADKGGDLGYVETAEFDPAIVAAAAKLAPGEISGPLLSRTGVSIIQLVDRRIDRARPLDEVRMEVRNNLFNKLLDEKYNYWLKESKIISHIDVKL